MRWLLALAVVLSGLVVAAPVAAESPMAREAAPLAAVDDRYGVVLVGNFDDGPGAESRAAEVLGRLGIRWWYVFGDSDTAVAGTTRMRLARPSMTPETVAARAAAYPGSYWKLGNEPNVPGQDDTAPGTFATWYHDVVEAVRRVDPAAKFIGPNVLNWDVTCTQCGGYTSGQSWSDQFVAAYRQAYNAAPPMDAWGAHVYDLDWANTPLVNTPRSWEQLEKTRTWLDGQQGLAGKPIWLTEFGVIFGYQGFTVDGNGKLTPAGPWRQDIVDGFVRDMVGQLTTRGPQIGVERWFLYSALPAREPYQAQAAGVALLKGTTSAYALTSEGQVYLAPPASSRSGGGSSGGSTSAGGGSGGGGGSTSQPAPAPAATVAPTVTAVPVAPTATPAARQPASGATGTMPPLPASVQVGAAPVAGPFTQFYAERQGIRLLGNTLAAPRVESGFTVQYFEKGRMEDHPEETNPAWRLMYGLLVDELVAAGAAVPVGGDASTLTYGTLQQLVQPQHRVAPPGDFGGGTAAMPNGDVFVPFSAALAPETGHVVPSLFWRYVNDETLFPGGWLHDVGLPVTAPVEAVVDKGPEKGRRIVVQAFQRTILTYDPLNPEGWQVERANVGTDYARAFPTRFG